MKLRRQEDGRREGKAKEERERGAETEGSEGTKSEDRN